MSKIKFILLFLTVSFCLSACNNDTVTKQPSPDEYGNIESIINNTDIVDTIVGTDLQLSISRCYADTEYPTAFDYIEVVDNDHDKLKAALSDWQENNRNIDEDIEMLDSFIEELEKDSLNLEIDSTFEIARMDNTVLSLFDERYVNGGGAHPNTYFTCVNFDVNTGEILSIKDIVKDYDEFKEAASTYIIDLLDNSVLAEGLFEDSRDFIKEFDEEKLDWTISQYGINLYFEAYALGSYAMGPIYISLPYNEFDDYMKPEYFEINGDCVCSVFNSSPLNYYFDQNTLLPTDDGVLEVKINSYYSDYSDEIYEVSCGLDSTTLQCAYVCSEKLMFIDDIWYLAVTVDEASGDYVTTLYRLEEDKVTVSDTIGAYYTHGTASASKVTMASNIYLMGTYSMKKDYSIEDGKFIPENDLYTLVSTDYVSELTTTRELPVSINGEDVLLPVGSKVRMDQTDAESVVYLYVIDTGEIAELQIEKQDTEYFYEILIDGISETEYFEMLPYAG